MSPRHIETLALDQRFEQPTKRCHVDETVRTTTMTVGTTFEATTVDGRARNGEVMRELTMPTLDARASLPERARSCELDVDMTRMTPMAAAARCSFVFARCRDRDRNIGARPAAAIGPTLA